MAARSTAYGRSVAGNLGSKSAGGVHVLLM